MPVSVSTTPFVALAQALKARGFAAHAARLEAVLDGVWTTSSELIGELGVVVLAVRAECKPLAATEKALLKACAQEVRKAWPGFGWRYWLPF